ncbi:Protein N-lysine methyltransferase METTL21A [Hondaea fermentalgiana]|uniref:Protein N-lysine methyltransferase METTL21A n=1 Tax=Hondaea fermentalgiana TaxID=2315210 RepID=A0A2R5G0X5_9STRA|nr:Protein N-lysine methyltransferase METTL21A [Hondaea fermentalgiana]|eukprot:GBG23949.1 Protein N-lysine methyltransferase METTL21A [Hondaea fermentalgiana]
MTELERRDGAAERAEEAKKATLERGGVAYTLLTRRGQEQESAATASATDDEILAKAKENKSGTEQEVESLEDFTARVRTAIRVEEQSLTHSKVALWQDGKMLELELTFPEESIQPIFSGACWAGTVVWPAALLLCEHLKTMADTVKDQRVLELGSGLGVPGMVCQLLGAKEVILTEQDPLPELLRRNVDANFANDAPRPLVDTLDWEEPEESSTNAQEPFDLILISDCVYQELYGDSWRALADCIKALSRPKRATLTLNALERRKADGVDEFLAYCREIGVCHKRIQTLMGPENEQLELYEMWTE